MKNFIMKIYEAMLDFRYAFVVSLEWFRDQKLKPFYGRLITISDNNIGVKHVFWEAIYWIIAISSLILGIPCVIVAALLLEIPYAVIRAIVLINHWDD